MKRIVAFILTLSFCNACFSQTDTIRIYAYYKRTDSWKLEVKNSKTFSLYNNLLKYNDFTTKGRCIITDTTFQFLCDTSKLKNKNLANNEVKRFSNIPFILTGTTFIRKETFFIPYNINPNTEDSTTTPKGIFAIYYKGDGFNSKAIELKKDSTYIFHDHSCVAHFTEGGTWSVDGGIITLVPTDKEEYSMLEWITKNRKLYLTEDYLIGMKTKKTYTTNRKAIVTETYSFLSKEF